MNIIDNKYKYYLPNLMRHHGKVEKDQVPHWDYPFIEKCIKRQHREKGNIVKNQIDSINTLL